MLVYITYKDDTVEKIKDVDNVEINNIYINLDLDAVIKQIRMSIIKNIMVI